MRGDAPTGWELMTKGLPETTHVQAITVHPGNPDVVYVGTQHGPYRSVDRGERWERLPFPEDGGQVWSILVHPTRPRTILAGTSPVGIFRSDDEGATWRRLPKAVQAERVKMPFACRVMRMAIDPAEPDHVYAALEVGGTSFDALYVNVDGRSGYFARSLNAYGKEGTPCPRCGSTMRRVMHGGRSSHYCPRCQRAAVR